MVLGIVGVSHETASLEQREAATRSVPLEVGVPLVTCNRVELYAAGEEGIQAHGWRSTLAPEGYAHWGIACFRHLVQVTAGLKSALRGEADIQGQVRRAYLEASQQRQLAPALHYLFQKSLKLGKEARTQFSQYQTTPCYGAAVLEQMANFLEKGCRTLLVGSSQVNRRIAEALIRAGYRSIDWCSRATHGKPLPGGHVRLMGFEALERWQDYDLIVCATRCPHYLIEQPERLLNRGPKLLIDLSVPRNIDPNLATVSCWRHLGLDQLHAQMAGGLPPQPLWEEVEQHLDQRVSQLETRLTTLQTASA
jgi:glutamyl-tRNA reductase